MAKGSLRILLPLYSLVVLALLLILSACETSPPPTRIPAVLADLQPQLAEALIAEDDSQIINLCYEIGVHRVIAGAAKLVNKIQFDSEENYFRTLNEVGPYNERIFRCLANEFHCDRELFDHHQQRSYSYAQAIRFREIRQRLQELFHTKDLAPEQKLAECKLLLAELEPFHKALELRASVYSTMANCLDELGDFEGELEYRRKSLDVWLAGGLGRATIKQLGIVGLVFGKVGEIDSMLYYYERSRDAAYRSRHPQVVLFSTGKLLSTYYDGKGYLALAHDLRAETQRALREYKGSVEELELLLGMMNRHANEGAWGIVRDLLVRGESLYEQYGHELQLKSPKEEGLRRKRAQLLMATGNVDAGNRIFGESQGDVQDRPWREHYPRFLLDWGRGLLMAGRPHEAVLHLGEGFLLARKRNLPSEVMRLAPLYAQALFETGDNEKTRETLQLFAEMADSLEVSQRKGWIIHDWVRIRLALAERDVDGTDLAVTEALTRLERILTEIDATVEAYLFLDACHDIRKVLHEALGTDPILGYGLEMAWRSMYRHFGRQEERMVGSARILSTESGVVDLFAIAKDAAVDLVVKISAREAVHCVYLADDERVVRWAVSKGEVRRDVISGDPAALERTMTRLAARLAGKFQPGDDMLSDEDSEQLALLARTLLPEECLVETQPPTVYISGDRFLEGFPFEALNVASNGHYQPLLERSDVVYLRYDDEVHPVFPNGTGVILADPDLPLELRRRYPSLDPLPHTIAEAKAIQLVTPHSRLLMNSGATKQRLSELWEQMDFLIVSAHFIRDAETPYFTFLPLAMEAGNTDRMAGMLDLTDVRRADLSKCGLVVLSGCATGAPFSDTAVWGPGLGDAFLDAGASAVIQTFWQVKDSKSRELMTHWAHEWAAGESPATALCRVRRGAFSESGRRLPFNWAAYSIKLGGL